MKSFLIGLFGLTLLPAIGAVCWYTDHFGAFLAVMFVLFLFSGDRTPTGGRDVGRRSATSTWPERSSLIEWYGFWAGCFCRRSAL